MDDTGKAIAFAMRVFVDISATIFVPAVVAAVLGKVLDTQYGTGRVSLFVLLALSFLGTAMVLVKKIRFYTKEYQQLIAR